MLTPCEVAIKCVLPVIRSMVAKELTHKYGLKQKKTANLLGITQAAVSHYLRKARGTALNLDGDEQINNSVKDIAATLYGKNANAKELRVKVCDVCEIIRSRGLMCKPHKRLEPDLNSKECVVCLP